MFASINFLPFLRTFEVLVWYTIAFVSHSWKDE